MKNSKINNCLIAFTVAILAVVSMSCGASQSGAGAISGKLQSYTPQNGAANKQSPTVQWTNVYASVNLNISRPMSLGCSGKLTMQYGEYVHVSMRFLGMEVAAFYADNETVYFVDKYHRYLFAEPLANLLGDAYGYLTLKDIQQIILGQTLLESDDTVTILPSRYVDTADGLAVASQINITATPPQGTIEASMSWNPNSATWNDPNRKASFKVPDNYTRLGADDLLQILRSMSF